MKSVASWGRADLSGALGEGTLQLEGALSAGHL